MSAYPHAASTPQDSSIQLRSLDDKQDEDHSANRAYAAKGNTTPSSFERSRSASPDIASLPLQRWNEPRGNIARFAAAFYSMFVFGLSDAAYGALLPYVRSSIDTRSPSDMPDSSRSTTTSLTPSSRSSFSVPSLDMQLPHSQIPGSTTSSGSAALHW